MRISRSCRAVAWLVIGSGCACQGRGALAKCREHQSRTKVQPGLLMRTTSAASSSHQQADELGAGEQLQEALELASMGEVQPGKSASIKSISDSIQSSMACCFSSQISRRSASGSRRQLSNCYAEAFGYDKNERKRESDEPGAHCCWRGRTWPGRLMCSSPSTMPARASTAAGASNANPNITLGTPRRNDQA